MNRKSNYSPLSFFCKFSETSSGSFSCNSTKSITTSYKNSMK